METIRSISASTSVRNPRKTAVDEHHKILSYFVEEFTNSSAFHGRRDEKVKSKKAKPASNRITDGSLGLLFLGKVAELHNRLK
jgi:hypothetical protein